MEAGASCVSEAEYVMELPPAERYSDVHSGSPVPSLALSVIHGYFDANSKKISRLYTER